MVEVEVRILRGFPVLAQVTVCPPEPAAGIPTPYIDEIILCHHVTGKSHGDWLWNRIMATPGEEDRLYERIWDALRNRDERSY